jgi:multidrug resistance efflux pump
MKTPFPANLLARLKKALRWRFVIPTAAALVVGLTLWLRVGGPKDGQAAVFTARKGPLNITVLEGGSVRAVESQEVKCEVKIGYQGIKILKIVDEGYEVTEDDIRTNKVLVELDSSDLQKQITQQDIQYESAAANLTDAQQNYEIQLNQNLSDIKAAEQKVRFARMDFDKFLGDNVTQEIVDQLGLEKELAALPSANDSAPPLSPSKEPKAPSIQTNFPPKELIIPAVQTNATTTERTTPVIQFDTTAKVANVKPAVLLADAGSRSVGVLKLAEVSAANEPNPATNALNSPESAQALPSVPFDFSKYANIDALGDGEAKQKLRKFQDDFQVAQKEEGQAKVQLEGTKRLFEKGFVTKIDMEKDEIAYENNRLKVQTAETARDLFLKYEFPKTAEENLSKDAEAVRELMRARKAAISKLAQAQARLKSAQGQYNIQSRQKKDFYDQLEKCTIKAKRPGLVVYGGSREDMMYYGGEERIREGATVRERQSIITIPDMTKMSVRVKIHESYIKKVKKGQKARITVDAFPDKVLDGEVTQVGVLPDSQNMWMNPDLKVYLTTVTIQGTNDWLKPGMSAKVEIFVSRLPDVVYVPVQAVSALDGKQVCYLANSHKPEQRMVEVGEFNDEFIEIKSGLKEGDKVLLRAAETSAPQKTDDKKEQPEKEKSPPQPAAPAPGGAPIKRA